MQSAQPIRSDRYRIARTLGAGESGVVFQAHDVKRQESVALKTIRERSAEQTYNLKREFRALQKVQHPNLVRLHELVVDGEDAFFSMELVDGHDILEGLGVVPRDLDCIRDRFSQLAIGISALHRAEKLHRDLKPSNVLIERSTGRVVIVDFGLAVATEGGETSKSVHGQLAGTYAYMSPEQSWGQGLTPAADWYAFGVTLFEALTGQLPWPTSAAEAFAKKQSSSVPTSALEAAGVPQPWITFIERLTLPQPEERPQQHEILQFFLVDVDGPSDQAGPSLLFGREESSERFRRAFKDRRKQVVVEVTGRSGIGKTTFLRHHVDRHSEDRTVFVSGCYDDVTAPFAALDELVDNLTRRLLQADRLTVDAVLSNDVAALTTVFPILERVPGFRRGGARDPIRTRRAATRALAHVLETVRVHEGGDAICLVLDDLQWADSESGHFLADVLSFFPTSTRVELVLAHRKDAPTPFIEIVKGRMPVDASWSEIHLSPLSPAALEAMATDATEGLSLDAEERAKRIRRVVTSSAGIPFNATLLARVQSVNASEGANEGEAAAWIRSLLTQDLSSDEAAILSMASVAHIPLPEAVLLQALTGDRRNGAEALDSLRQRSLLRPRQQDGRWEMFHDRIRVLMAAAMGEEQRSDTERILAEALDGHAEDRIRAQAWTHWRAIGDVDRAAWGAYKAGLDAFQKLAFAQAVDCFEQALLAPDAAGVGIDHILRQLGHASALLGRVQEAVDQLLMAAAHAPTQVAIDDERQAAELLIGAGEIEKGKSILAQAFAKIGERLPQNSLGRALAVRGRLRVRGFNGLNPRRREPTAEQLLRVDTWWVAVGALGYVEPVASFIAQNEHMRLTLAFDEPNRFARALSLEMVYVGSRLGNTSVNQLEERLTAFPKDSLASDVNAFILLSRGYVTFLRGRFRRAEEILEEALVAYESLGARRWQENLGRIHLVFVQLYLGDFHRASSLYDEHRHVLQSTGDRLNLGMLELGAGFAIALANDDVPLAHERINGVSEDFEVLPDNLHYIGTFARVQVALYANDDDGIEEIWAPERKRLRAMLVFENAWIVINWIEGIVRLRTRTPDPSAALGFAKKIEKAKTTWGDAIASILRAGVAVAREGNQAAATAGDVAIDRLRAANMETHAAAVALWRARLLEESAGAERAAEKMRSAGISNPDHWLRMWAPIVPSQSNS